MQRQEFTDTLLPIYRDLEQGNIEPLLAVLSPDVEWFVDWKGEGIFGGGPLFGRHCCQGPAEVTQFFSKMHELLKTERLQPVDFIVDGDEAAIVLGNARWRSLRDNRIFESDWTMRLAWRQGKIRKCRFMTLPQNHISTFIEDEELRALYTSDGGIEQIVTRFQKLYFDAYLFGRTWAETYWLGIPVFKCPLDLWVYQELIVKLKPDVIVETGTNYGGSALFLATMCDLVGSGKVVSVDITHHYAGGKLPQHDRVTYLLGSSTSDEILGKVAKHVKDQPKVLVILDSDHHKEHVIEELRHYHKFVSKGSYLVVEDTNLNGQPVKKDFGPGPMEAVEEFMDETTEFVIDREMEKFYMTSNPKGFLLKVGS